MGSKIGTLAFVTGTWVVACGGSTTPAPTQPPSGGTSLEAVSPSRNLHLRVAFDGDPQVYVGRFVPEGITGAELDENRASKTSCSKHFTVREQAVNQEMDELVYASNQASGSLGVIASAGAGNAQASSSKGSVLRVHYTIKKKLQIDSDPEALRACCTKNPGDCTKTVVGEFLMGSGEIYQAAETARSASGELGVPPVAARAAVSDVSQWKKVQSFKDTYFAFLPVTTGTVNETAAKAAAEKDASCDFCRKLPEDASGLYFCGVSSPAVEETGGRDAAMQSARTQVIKYLGEQIQTKSQSLSSTAKGLVSDERFVEAFAKGLATRVKDKQYCSEKENSPEHRSVYKVLAYVPNDALVEAASKAVDDVAAAKGAAVKPADAAAAKDAIKKATAK